MVVNRKVTGKAASMPVGIGIGLAVSLTLTVGMAALAANLIQNEKLEQSSIGYAAMLILLVSSAVGAAISAGIIKHRRLVVCMISGGIYYLMLLCCTALFFGGQYQGMGVSLLLVLGGCGTVALIGMRGEKRPVMKHKKYRSR